MTIHEFSNTATSSPFDEKGNNYVASASTLADQLASPIAQANELIFMAAHMGGDALLHNQANVVSDGANVSMILAADSSVCTKQFTAWGNTSSICQPHVGCQNLSGVYEIVILVVSYKASGSAAVKPIRLYANGQYFANSVVEGGSQVNSTVLMHQYANGTCQILRMAEATSIMRLYANGQFQANTFSEV